MRLKHKRISPEGIDCCCLTNSHKSIWTPKWCPIFALQTISKMASAAEDERGQSARRFCGRRAAAAAAIRPCSSTLSVSGRSASSSSSSSPPVFLPSILLLFLFQLFIVPVFHSKSAVVSACFPGGPGSGCCSAPSCGSVPRCTPSSMASSHLSSFSHMAPPPPPIYGHDDDHQHYGGGYDKHGYGEGYETKGYGGSGYGDKGGYGNGGKDYGGGGYGDRGGYENKDYGAKYGDNGYDKGYGGGYGGDKEYGGGGYGSPYPSTNVQYPAYPSSYVAPPPAYPPINYNNFYPIAPPAMPSVYTPYIQQYPATPIQYPAPPYQASGSNSLPPYVQQSLYSSPPGIIPSSSPYSSVDLYQPNLPPQFTADQPYTLPTSSSPDLLGASPYRQPTLSPANGPFVMTLAEPPAFVSAPIAAQQQPPAGGYSAKVKSTKVLTTLVDKFKKDRLEKHNKKNER